MSEKGTLLLVTLPSGPLRVPNVSDLDPVRDTHYLPSRVHPALAMYSTFGKSVLKGCTSSFSWVKMI